MKHRKKRLLYIMSVDWNWIAQRPHFMALELAKYYKVTVVYPRYLYRPWKGQQNVKPPGRCIGVPQIPLQENYPFLQRLSTHIFERFTGPLDRYDIVWFGTPMFARILPEHYSGIVVYDYMDDIAALQPNARIASYVRKAHTWLLQRADLILVTSQYLMNTLNANACGKASLVRNAFRKGMESRNITSGESLRDREDCEQPHKKQKVRLGYVGTISEWMDFPLLMESLNRFPQIEYHFWGPSNGEIPSHERLFFHGVIEHDRIREAIREIDCMIMPFRVNDIVLAVDPVKLYEYISFGKNIIAVRYPEVERFAPYAWLYEKPEEYHGLVKRLCDGTLPVRFSRQEQAAFLADNSWEMRGKVVYRLLEELRL